MQLREDVKIVKVVKIVASQVKISNFIYLRTEQCQIILQILVCLSATLYKRGNEYNQLAREIKSYAKKWAPLWNGSILGAFMGLQLDKHPSFIPRVSWVTASPASTDVSRQTAEKWCQLNGLSASNRAENMGFAQLSFVQHCYGLILQTWRGLEDLEGFERCFPRINSSLSGREEDWTLSCVCYY